TRAKLRGCQGLDGYKDLWRDEVFLNQQRDVTRLSEVVKNWQGLGRAFRLRHRLVHGATSCGTEYAKERVDWAIDATNNVRDVCKNKGINLDLRLPVRRSVKA
ncbi:MAG: hypothetical protein LH702_32070, partial [Phormidesmis sp. CAN_BIN44]|nr:hypothetical protein [Phormidesmis sp. CAN_BIN44]